MDLNSTGGLVTSLVVVTSVLVTIFLMLYARDRHEKVTLGLRADYDLRELQLSIGSWAIIVISLIAIAGWVGFRLTGIAANWETSLWLDLLPVIGSALCVQVASGARYPIWYVGLGWLVIGYIHCLLAMLSYGLWLIVPMLVAIIHLLLVKMAEKCVLANGRSSGY